MENCVDEQGNIINMTNWLCCNKCLSDDYIIGEISNKKHWAYRSFKTKNREEFKAHEKSPEHLAHYKDFRCGNCRMQFYSKKDFEQHQHTLYHKRNAKTEHRCDVCDITFEYPSQLEAHSETQKHKDKSQGNHQDIYYCKDCNFETKYKSHWDIHTESKKHKIAVGELEEKVTYHCPECDYTTKFESQWNIHCKTDKHKIAIGEIKAFDKPTMHRCECCNYETPIKQVFDKHNQSKKHMVNYINKNNDNIIIN